MSLAALDAALFASLSATQWITATGSTVATPFALVGRYAGELSVLGIRETCAQYPAALLRYDGGASMRTVDAVEGVDDTGTEAWTVFVAVEEPREIDDAIAATDAQVPGALALIDAVLLALNGWCSMTPGATAASASSATPQRSSRAAPSTSTPSVSRRAASSRKPR